MKLIGIHAKARHGKDTCAQLILKIAQEKGLRLGTWAMAHPLKALVYGEAGGEYTFDDVFVIKPAEVRRLLQRRGTEEGRDKFGESVWTLQSEAYLKLFEANFPIDGVVFTDIRFPNEVEFVNAGGIDVSVFAARVFARELATQGFNLDSDDPKDIVEFTRLLDVEQHAIAVVQREIENLVKQRNGIVIHIDSDRPTLTGEAAQHASETALDGVEFEYVITNNQDTTFDDLEEQLRPIVNELFQL